MKGGTTFFFIFFISFCFSQNETNNWVFGDQIILNFPNLPNTPPTPSFTSNLIASSGSSSISDKNGQLLLYSDGVVVLNKNNIAIPNGTLLFGDNEMAQSSIIIPKPGSSSIYYLITVKTFLDVGPPDIPIPKINPGLYYSIIDISKDDGVIVAKNEKLLSFEVGKISAVHHKDGKSIWFTTTGREKETDKFLSFYTFKIDENGIDFKPIVSDNLRHEGDFNGFLKFSPNGTKIASSNLEKELVIFDFDNETGIVSNKLNLIKTSVFFDQPSVFGVEFSNDSKILYTTSYNDSQLTETIFQYDLTNLHPTEKIKKLITRNQYRYSSLQLSNNSKIYKTQTLLNNKAGSFLDVINSPDKVGNNCDLQTDAILVDKRAGKGLPNFIQSYFRTRILNEKSCVNEIINFEVDTYATITAANWDFGDGNTANVITPQHTFSNAGTYNVKVSITINNRVITTFKDITIFPLPVLKSGQNLTQCDPDNNGKDFFNLTTINPKISDEYQDLVFYYYTNENDARNDTNRIINPESFENTSNPQKIYTRVINKNDCYQIESFDIESVFVNISDLPELIVCEDSDNILGNQKGLFDLANQKNVIRNLLSVPSSSTINFYPSQKDAQTLTNQVNDQFESESTSLWIRIENSLGCGGIKSFKLTVNSTPKIQLKDTYTLCFFPEKHAPLIIEADASNDTYEWKDSQNSVISNNQTLTLTTPGKYSLTVYKQENGIICSNTKEFQVSYPTSPTFATLESNNSNDINTVFIEVSGNSTYEFSLDNQTFTGNSNSYTFTNVTPGIKTVYVRDSNSCEPPIQQEVTVLGYPEFFTPNGDGINDTWNIPGATTTFFKEIDIKIFNRYGKVLYSINNNNAGIGWTGTFNNKILPSDNYWFKVRLIDYSGKIIEKTGNISLLRK